MKLDNPNKLKPRSSSLYAHWFPVLLIVVSFGIQEAACGQITSSFTEPYEQRQVAAAEPGVVANVFIREGQPVKAGETLAELQNNELKQKRKLAELRAQSDFRIRSAAALAQVRQRQRDTLTPMLEAGHANHAEVEKAVMDHEIAAADLEAAKLTQQEQAIEVEIIEAEIERRTIRSPIQGVVTEIHHRSGEYISAADPKFATVASLDRLRVRFYLLANTIQTLQVGESVLVWLDGSSAPTPARIDFISPITDPDSGTTRIDVVLENAQLKIRSGVACHWEPPKLETNSGRDRLDLGSLSPAGSDRLTGPPKPSALLA